MCQLLDILPCLSNSLFMSLLLLAPQVQSDPYLEPPLYLSPRVLCKTIDNNATLFFIISNYEKLLQNLPGLCKQSKNIKKFSKFCIKSKKKCFWKLCKNYSRCIKPRGQLYTYNAAPWLSRTRGLFISPSAFLSPPIRLCLIRVRTLIAYFMAESILSPKSGRKKIQQQQNDYTINTKRM